MEPESLKKLSDDVIRMMNDTFKTDGALRDDVEKALGYICTMFAPPQAIKDTVIFLEYQKSITDFMNQFFEVARGQNES